jgi:RNA polymerase sigma factor (TIGR02999 family)
MREVVSVCVIQNATGAGVTMGAVATHGMKAAGREGLTELLHLWSSGDRQAAERAMTLVYEELREVARRFFRRERAAHTLDATAVVHEAFARLVERDGVSWQNRAHFFGVFARVMRRVLVDYARERNASKRGGHRERVTLTESALLTLGRTPDLLALDEALEDLAVLDPGKAAIVELRFFGGCSIEDTAASLGLSTATVNRQWRQARAWLFRELSPESLPPRTNRRSP